MREQHLEKLVLEIYLCNEWLVSAMIFFFALINDLFVGLFLARPFFSGGNLSTFVIGQWLPRTL